MNSFFDLFEHVVCDSEIAAGDCRVRVMKFFANHFNWNMKIFKGNVTPGFAERVSPDCLIDVECFCPLLHISINLVPVGWVVLVSFAVK